MISLEDCEVEKMGGTRIRYTFNGLTPRGETVCVDMTACYPDNRSKNSLPNYWYRHGLTDTVLDSYWIADVYVTTTDGRCIRKYDPTATFDQKKHMAIINFEWMLPTTIDNGIKILDEICRRANEE